MYTLADFPQVKPDIGVSKEPVSFLLLRSPSQAWARGGARGREGARECACLLVGMDSGRSSRVVSQSVSLEGFCENCFVSVCLGSKRLSLSCFKAFILTLGKLSLLPQVFHSLLKAHAMEARAIVRQAMAILTPAVPARMEDGHQMLTHWTRKIIVEEGHTVPQLVHILHLIVQHFKVRKEVL